MRLDVTGDGASLPSFSILADVVVDETFRVVEDSAASVLTTVFPELVAVDAPARFNGAIAVSYATTDEKGGLSVKQAIDVIDVAPRNVAPVAGADALRVVQGRSLTFTLGDLLANDRDGNGDLIRVTGVATPAHGTLTFSDDSFDAVSDQDLSAFFVYTPDLAYDGQETLTYTLGDGKAAPVSGALAITIAPVLVAGDDSFAAMSDPPLVIDVARLLANDASGDGLPLTITSIGGVTHGTASLVDGAVTFVSDHYFEGLAGFDYTVGDGAGHERVAHVDLHVTTSDHAPVLGRDVFAGVEDTPLTILIDDLLANDADIDGETLRFVSIQPDAGTRARVQVLPGGRISFVPDGNVYGAMTFTYEATDGWLTSQGHVEIDVAAVNDAPVANMDGVFVGSQNQPLRISLARLIAHDIDVEGDAFSIVGALDGDNGTVVLDGADAVFTPRFGYYGDAAFKYVARDAHGAQSHGTVTLLIEPTFHPAIAVPDSGFSMDQDTTLDIDPAQLLANDIDADGNPLTFLGFVDGPATPLDNGLWRITPPANFSGALTLTYAITNGSQIVVTGDVTVEVRHVEHAPTAVGDAFAMTEDAALTTTVRALLANDYDLDSQYFALSRIVEASHAAVALASDGTVTVTPEANHNGLAFFDYEIVDSTGRVGTGRVDLTVAPVNDAPVVATPIPAQSSPEDAAWRFVVPAGTFADVEGDALNTIAHVAGGAGLPAWLGYDATTMTFAGTPPANWNGAVDLVVVASDPGGASATAAFTLTVTPVNDAPVLAQALAAQSATAGAAWSYVVPATTFADVDGDGLGYSARLADGAPLPAWLTFNAATRAFAGMPPATFTGSLSIVAVAADPGGLSATAAFTLSVTGGSTSTPIVGSPWGGSTLQGTSGSDTIVASGWNNVIVGGGGNDTITAGSGSATVTTGAGNDTITLSGYNNVVDAGQGDNKIAGSQGSTRVTVGNGSNRITLDGYSNVVTLGSGANVVTGGLGSNTITMNAGSDDIALYGWTNRLIANAGAHALVHDIGWGTAFDVAAANVQLSIELFDANAIVTLRNGAGGFASAEAVKTALVSDGHVGAMLARRAGLCRLPQRRARPDQRGPVQDRTPGESGTPSSRRLSRLQPRLRIFAFRLSCPRIAPQSVRGSRSPFCVSARR